MPTQRSDATPPAVVAYSYIRWSHPSQAAGDSLRRQTEQAAAYAARRGWTLDTSLSLRDMGVSAFRGRNAAVGALRTFLDAIKAKLVKPGSVLIVENVDRISRQGIDDGYDLIKSILKAGVRIVTLLPEREYDATAVKGLTKGALEIQLYLERAAEESERKSERVGAAWANKRKRLRENRQLLTHQLPAWVTVGEGGKLAAIPERAAAVRRIYALAAAGYGTSAIVRKLNEEGVKPFGEPVVREGRRRPSRSGQWLRTYVGKILTTRQAVGEFQPCGKDRKPDGDPIPEYLPAVVTEGEWLAARAGLTARRHKRTRRDVLTDEVKAAIKRLHEQGKRVVEIAKELGVTREHVYRHRGIQRQGRKRERGSSVGLPNAFAGLLHCANDGSTMYAAGRPGGSRLLVNTAATERGHRSHTFPYEVFERAVLACLREVNPADVLPGEGPPDETEALRRERDAVKADIAAVTASLDANGYSPALDTHLRRREARLRELDDAVREAEVKAATPAAAAWQDAQGIIAALDAAPDPVDARLRLRAALQRMVDGVWVLVSKRGRDRLCSVQIFFGGGTAFRWVEIVHRAPLANQLGGRQGRWWARTRRHPAAAETLDLRKPGNAEAALGYLEMFDPAGIYGGIVDQDDPEPPADFFYDFTEAVGEGEPFDPDPERHFLNLDLRRLRGGRKDR